MAQRRANQITSPGRIARRLRFEDNESSMQETQQLNVIPPVSIKLVSKPFSSVCDHLLNEIVSFQATIIHQWRVEKLLHDLNKSHLVKYCLSRNTILAKTNDGLCLIELPFREYKYWAPVFEHGTGRTFEFSFVRYCGRKLIRKNDSLYYILEAAQVRALTF
jgi:hypothetical protein